MLEHKQMHVQEMYVYFAFYVYFNVWAFEMTKRDN